MTASYPQLKAVGLQQIKATKKTTTNNNTHLYKHNMVLAAINERQDLKC